MPLTWPAGTGSRDSRTQLRARRSQNTTAPELLEAVEWGPALPTLTPSLPGTWTAWCHLGLVSRAAGRSRTGTP